MTAHPEQHLAALPGGEEAGQGSELPSTLGSVVSAAARPIGRGLAEGAIDGVVSTIQNAIAADGAGATKPNT